jgi:hypothetical protein
MANKRMGKKSGSNVLPYSKWKLGKQEFLSITTKCLLKDYAEKRSSCSSGASAIWIFISSGVYDAKLCKYRCLC